MLLAHTPPVVTDIALTGGTWLTADTWKALTDGRPSRAARIQRSGEVTLSVTLKNAIVPGVIALLGLNLPYETVITAAGVSSTLRWLPGGTRCAHLLPQTTTGTTTITVTIPGTTPFQIGELAIMPVADLPIEPGWSVELIDPTETTRDRGSQIASAARVPYRRLSAHLQAQGANHGYSWENLRMALTQDRRCIAIPRHADVASLNRTAIYGTARIGPITHLGGDWYSAPFTLDELPAAT